ncbi:MAG: methyltransferase domain-containing protein [Acidobacteriaceae bacterium]|nr:methyltransferase domain-containing protein [Acidobacteriaceae bacterium]
MTIAGSPFDKLAAQYDALWTRTPIGISQRLAVWRRLDAMFRPGDRMLDLGCGTGEDALHFKSRGVEVYGIDASAAMVGVARNRGVNAHRLAIESIADLREEFDGAISNFGALNCVARLEDVASALAQRVRLGGCVGICLLGRACIWEMFYFAIRGNPRKAFRRFTRGKTRSSIGADVRYPSRRQVEQAFGCHFKLIGWSGIGLCVPPSYINEFNDGTIRGFSAVDACIAHWPVLRALADHRLFIFRHL